MDVDQKKITDCFWFLQNKCAKGEICEYRHNERARQNSKCCKLWEERKCTNENCPFRHPSGQKQVACIFFAQNKCDKGDACPFSHSVLSVESGGELRKLQLQIQKEEERLAEIKAETKRLEEEKKIKISKPQTLKPQTSKPQVSKPQVSKPQKMKSSLKKQSPKENSNPGITFVKTLDDIVKEKEKERQEKLVKNLGNEKRIPQKVVVEKKQSQQKIDKKKSQETEVAKNKPNNNKIAKDSEISKEKEDQGNFGIKSLDQIMKEKKASDMIENKKVQLESSKSSLPKMEIVQSSFVEEIKKKNHQKFGQLSPTELSPQKDPSPKRKSLESIVPTPPQVEQKRQKVNEVEAKPVVAKANLVKSDSLDELDDLLDFDVDSSGLNDTDIVMDDFDKELDELEILIST